MRSRASAGCAGRALSLGQNCSKRVFDIDNRTTAPKLRRQLKRSSRRHRRSAGDCQKSLTHLGPADPRPPGAGSRFIPDNLRAEKPLAQRKPTAPLALSFERAGAILEHFRRATDHYTGPKPAEATLGFSSTERRLTPRRAGDIARTRKKGCLNFLYLKRDAPKFPHSTRERVRSIGKDGNNGSQGQTTRT